MEIVPGVYHVICSGGGNPLYPTREYCRITAPDRLMLDRLLTRRSKVNSAIVFGRKTDAGGRGRGR